MSTLTSYLTVVKLKPIPNSLEDLVYNYEHKDQCLLTMQKGNHILSKFYVRVTFDHLIYELKRKFIEFQTFSHVISQKTTYPPYKEIGEWIDRNPQFLTNVYNGITNNIVKNHCVHLGVK